MLIYLQIRFEFEKRKVIYCALGLYTYVKKVFGFKLIRSTGTRGATQVGTKIV